MTKTTRHFRTSFRLDPIEPLVSSDADWQVKDEAEREFRRGLYHELGLKLYSLAWTDASLADDELTERIVQQVRAWGDTGRARFGTVHLGEEIEDDDGFEWFRMQGGDTGTKGDFNPWDYITARAFEFAPPPHFRHHHFGSERFVDVVREHGLTGLETLWVADRGRFRAPSQWYCLIATEPIGHGVDHEWYDRDAVQRRWQEQLTSDRPAHAAIYRNFEGQELAALEERTRQGLRNAMENTTFRSGETRVTADVLRDDWTTGSPAIDAFVRLALEQQSDFQLSAANPRFLRAHLPTTDFAYWCTHPDGPNSAGEWTRWRDLLCTRRARDVLIQERLMAPNDFRGALILSEPPPGGHDLDAGVECPPPFRTPGELIELRKDEARRWAKHLETEKPIRTPNLKRSIAQLRQARSDRPDDFLKRTTAKGLEKLLSGLPVSLPGSWREVLKTARGGDFGVEDLSCIVPDPGELLAFHRSVETTEVAAEDDYPTNRFYFARTDTGDAFAFELPTPLAETDPAEAFEDLPVLLVDHETGEEGSRWTGVADFLESVLTA